MGTDQRLHERTRTCGAAAPVISDSTRRPSSRFSCGEWPPSAQGGCEWTPAWRQATTRVMIDKLSMLGWRKCVDRTCVASVHHVPRAATRGKD